MADASTPHATLRAANLARQAEWDPGKQISLSFRGNELAGEVGEACNVIKKLDRERLGIQGSRDTVAHLAEELADVVICADLIAMAEGIDLDAAVGAKFNATSAKVGLATRMALPLPVGGDPDPWEWYAGPGCEPENYQLVEGSRDDVIAAARIDFDDGFTICEARKGTLKRSLPSAERIIEGMIESADDDGLFGEDSAGDHWRDTGNAEAELDALLKAWFDRNARQFPRPWQFAASRNEEYFAPEPVAADEAEACPVCAKPFTPDDVCATDIELLTCHAACLEGAPIVDLDTGEPCSGPVATFRYGDDQQPAAGSAADV